MKNFSFLSFLLCITSTIFFSSLAVDLILPTDFNKAMVSDKKDQKRYNRFLRKTPHKDLLKVVQKLYADFESNAEKRRSLEPIIPKIIHQIWIGPHQFPQNAREWQQTWKTLHPDWEYKLWTNEEVKTITLKNQKLFNRAKNWGEKADILRYEILYQFGGVYVDVDFEGLKPLDELHHVCDFYAGIHAVPLLFRDKLRVNNGIIGACPGHPILELAINRLPEFAHEKKVPLRTGPDFLTAMIAHVLPHSLDNGYVDMIFPSNFFYPSEPFDGSNYTIEPGTAFVQPETLAVHYYSSFWIKPPKKSKAS